MELRDLETFGEPGAVVYLADCMELMRLMPASCVDAVFADPPYRLSTEGGVTVKSGRRAPVDKGSWDRSLGSFEADHAWNVRWLKEARRVLKPDGTLWVSGTHHVIFSLGFALQSLGFRIIKLCGARSVVASRTAACGRSRVHLLARCHNRSCRPLLAHSRPRRQGSKSKRTGTSLSTCPLLTTKEWQRDGRDVGAP